MPFSPDIDINNPHTWRNNPSPPIEQGYVEQLTNIGRLSDGRPKFRFAWGQSRTCFFAGEKRILYVDTRIPGKLHTRHTQKKLQRDDLGELVKDKHGCHVTEVRYYDTKQKALADEEFGGLYAPEYSVEFIGVPLFFIERHKYVSESERQWERRRYGPWEDPATGVLVELCDLLGPYPHEGIYEAFVCVGKSTGERDANGGRVRSYRPIAQDVIDHVQEKIRQAERQSLISPEQYVREAEYLARQAGAKRAADLHQAVRDVLRPHRRRFIEGDSMSRPFFHRNPNGLEDFKI